MSQGTIIITGAAGGIGSALARLLQPQDFRLALVGRTLEKLEALQKELPGSLVFPADLTRPEETQTAFEEIGAAMGPVAGVAHCVGSILLKPAHLTTEEDWANTLQLNLTSSFHVLKQAVLLFQRQRSGGNLVFCSTAAARIGLANHEAIAAAKAGLEGLVRSAAASYATRGIRINAVAPGLVDTPLATRITSSEASLKASLAMHPLKRIGQPDDIARALAWFLDPAQTWVTGQILAVDGGLGGLKTLS